MSKQGKKYIKAIEQRGKMEVLAAKNAVTKVKELHYVKFDESVDVHVNLGIDASKGEQVVRGSVILPHGRGKSVKIVVFAKGDKAEEALKAGADYVGAEDLVEKILGGWMDFSFTVATPDMMGLVGKLARQLGPKGLLPNKKVGTVTFDVASVVSELKQGRVFFKNDKSGLVHFSFGKISFDAQNLYQNLTAFMKALVASKPATSKGKFLKKVTISSSMGVGIAVNPDEFSQA
jgi:large subunit ribosomal protein L1